MDKIDLTGEEKPKEKSKERKPKEEMGAGKKAMLSLFIVALVFVAAYTFKQNYFSQSANSLEGQYRKSSEVQGATIQEQASRLNNSKADLREAVQNNFNALKDQANNLDAEEIASSSPQVQKILQDLKSLEQYPKNQAKEACMRVCNGL